MNWQIVLVLLFALNMVLIWVASLLHRFGWYRLPGSLIFAYLPLLGVFLSQPRFELDYFWWRVVGVISICAGIIILAWAKKEIGRVFINIGELPAELKTSGPYHYVRHPVYLGLVFIYVGWWWVWAAVYSFYFGVFILMLVWLHAYLEEKLVLEKAFGDSYRQYRRRTGMFWIK